ncbi:hypothetical protein GW17_00061797, partial [Ensete ventricosum]
GKENLLSECKSPGGAFIPFEALSTVSGSSEEKKPAAGSPDLVASVAESRACGGGPKSVGRAPATVCGDVGFQTQHQPSRKARRCWSQELHRRFTLAIQQLGGAQGDGYSQADTGSDEGGGAHKRRGEKPSAGGGFPVFQYRTAFLPLIPVVRRSFADVLSLLLFQKYRLHAARLPNSASAMASPPAAVGGSSCVPQQSVSPSASPQSPLQLVISARAPSIDCRRRQLRGRWQIGWA